MTSARPRRLRALLVGLVTVLSLLPATVVAPATAQDLEDVEAEVDQLEESVAKAATAFEDTEAAVAAAEEELSALERRTAELEQEATLVNEMLEARARAVFKHGGSTVLASFMSADGPGKAVERASLMNAVTGRDQGRLEAATNLRVQIEQNQALTQQKAAQLASLKEQQSEQLDALVGELEGAKVLQADLRRRDARKKTIQRGVQNGTYACMFERPFHFRDTWGAPRSGGRRHKGTDVFSYYGAPVYAFNGGRISRMNNSGLGGISLYISGDDGALYYYTHLSGYAPGIHVGKYVEAGEHVAYNGDSGNARGGSPHVHFQIHPGHGAPVNPYPWLAPACF